MPAEEMDKDESQTALLKYVFGGALGPTKGKGVSFALLRSDDTTFSWSAALEDIDDETKGPVDRYLVNIDRQSGEISPPQPIVIELTDQADAIIAATGQHLATSARFIDGTLSISYLITVKEDPDVAYVMQMRHHGKVASMDALMSLISESVDAAVLPIPRVFPIPGEGHRQGVTGMGRQISQFVPGDIASKRYPTLPRGDKNAFVQRVALAFQAVWDIPMSEPRLIGELIASKNEQNITLSVGPDRHYSLGGPFVSVRDYLHAHIKYSLAALEKQQGVDGYKKMYLERLRAFVNTQLNCIPEIVENVPIVVMHADMGPHNIIVSGDEPSRIEAVIDWEFAASAPFASSYRILEMYFRKWAENLWGPEYDGSDELRQAFWGAIPCWKAEYESDATQAFLEWFKFGLFLKPEPLPDGLAEGAGKEFWEENILVVEHVLRKYSKMK